MGIGVILSLESILISIGRTSVKLLKPIFGAGTDFRQRNPHFDLERRYVVVADYLTSALQYPLSCVCLD